MFYNKKCSDLVFMYHSTVARELWDLNIKLFPLSNTTAAQALNIYVFLI